MRKSAPFRIAGQLRCKAADDGFKQVQIAYLALISYLDKLVQPSYTLSMQISPLGLPRAVLGNACHFDLRLITLISALINGNVQTISACKELTQVLKVYLEVMPLKSLGREFQSFAPMNSNDFLYQFVLGR